jgi:hypothetical protein
MDFERLMKHFLNSFEPLDKLAHDLGVDCDSLIDLEVGWNKPDKAWAIPMRDGDNKIIGIHLRSGDGSKKAVTGSRNGLFIPQIEPQSPAYICEGASNTASLLTMGFYAIGRPSCNSGGEMLKVALKRLGVSRIVVVADNDEIKYPPCCFCKGDGCEDCEWTGKNKSKGFYPGQDGAKKLKKELGLSSVIFTPPNPIKDVRQLLQKLGVESARNYITSSVSQKIWTKA